MKKAWALGAVVVMGLMTSGCEDAGRVRDFDPHEIDSDTDALHTFKPSEIVTDAQMTDAGALTAEQIDAFLERPYPDLDDLPSCLASYTSGGKTAGRLIADAAQEHGVSPVYLLVHLQKESSLVADSSTKCSSTKLAKAFGCGCPDGQGCSSQYATFAGQVDCAAAKTRAYLDDLEGGGSTVSGWKVGKAKTTLDKRTIVPKNAATAALYTYTPWVGDKSASGNKAPFGNFLFWKVWLRFSKTLGAGG